MKTFYVLQWEKRNRENNIESYSTDGLFTSIEDIVAELDRIEIAERQAYEQFTNTEVIRIHHGVLTIRPEFTIWYRAVPVQIK